MTLQIGIIAILISAILYTIAIWGERLVVKKLNTVLFITFAVGFLLDVFGTTTMSQYATVGAHASHTVSGWLAIIIMAIHFMFACFAVKYQRMAKLFHKGSIFAWFVWMIALITGMMM